MVFFAVQKLVSLIRSHLFIFAFISIALGDWPKKTLVWFMSENVLSVISSRSFMVSRLKFKSLSHFVVRGCVLTSLIYMWLSNFPSTTCWRDCLFPIVYSCLLCQRLIDHRYVGLFLGSLFSAGPFMCVNSFTLYVSSVLIRYIFVLTLQRWKHGGATNRKRETWETHYQTLFGGKKGISPSVQGGWQQCWIVPVHPQVQGRVGSAKLWADPLSCLVPCG